MIVTSFLVTLISALIAAPFAIAVALFMTEYSSKRSAKFLQSVTELLVGIPSVVYGFLGLTIIVPAIRNIWWNWFRYFGCNVSALCNGFANYYLTNR